MPETLAAAAPIIGGAMGMGGSILGGLMGQSAAKKAANEQAASMQKALDFQQGVYGTTQQNLAPYMQAGTNALSVLSGFYGLPTPGGLPNLTPNALSAWNQFTQTPFYQFPLSQQQQGLDRYFATGAGGGFLGGGRAGALEQLGAGYASQNFNNWINQLSTLASRGQTAAGTVAQTGTSLAQPNLQALSTLGGAQAAGTVGGQNALMSALQSLPAQMFGSSYGQGGIIGSLINALSGPSSTVNPAQFGTGGFAPGSTGASYNQQYQSALANLT